MYYIRFSPPKEYRVVHKLYMGSINNWLFFKKKVQNDVNFGWEKLRVSPYHLAIPINSRKYHLVCVYTEQSIQNEMITKRRPPTPHKLRHSQIGLKRLDILLNSLWSVKLQPITNGYVITIWRAYLYGFMYTLSKKTQ